MDASSSIVQLVFTFINHHILGTINYIRDNISDWWGLNILLVLHDLFFIIIFCKKEIYVLLLLYIIKENWKTGEHIDCWCIWSLGAFFTAASCLCLCMHALILVVRDSKLAMNSLISVLEKDAPLDWLCFHWDLLSHHAGLNLLLLCINSLYPIPYHSHFKTTS